MSFPLTVTSVLTTTASNFCSTSSSPHQKSPRGEEGVPKEIRADHFRHRHPILYHPNCHHYSNPQMETMMLSSPSPPPPLPSSAGLPPQTQPPPLSMAPKTVPIRKQSVFVAPTGLSTIRPPISHEAIKQRIDKMIQDNAAIVESVAHHHHPHHHHYPSSHHRHHHRTSSGNHRSRTTSSSYMISSPTTVSGHLDLVRTYQHHPHFLHHQQPPSQPPPPPPPPPPQHPVIHVIIDDDSSSSCSPTTTATTTNHHHLSYSKLQSALLGGTGMGKPDDTGGLAAATAAETFYHRPHHRPSLVVQPVSADSCPDVGRKYSEHVWSSYVASQFRSSDFGGASFPPHPSATTANSLFPSLYHPTSTVVTHHQQQHSSPKPSVIINTRDLQTMMMANPNDHHPESHSSVSDSRSSEKSCLVRNLLLNNPAAQRLSTGSPPIYNNLGAPLSRNGPATDQSGSSDTSIIKDLLLKSRTDFDSAGSQPLVEPPQHLPSSRKRSRSEAPPAARINNQIMEPATATAIITPVTTTSQQQLGQQKPNPVVFTCQLCSVQYRNEQNLEVHKKYYCCGQSANVGQQQHAPKQQSRKISRTTSASAPTPVANQTRERKISVLDRPSIITYPVMSRRPNTVTLEEESNSTGSSSDSRSMAMMVPTLSATETQPNPSIDPSSYNFGNILKSKLLASTSSSMATTATITTTYATTTSKDGGAGVMGYCPRHHHPANNNDDADDDEEDNPNGRRRHNHTNTDHFQALKKRKTSEPAFRLHYHHYGETESKRESTVRQHRASVLQTSPGRTKADLPDTPVLPPSAVPKLEILPAYMPYLMRPPTKISIKGPVIFPVLQGLIDNCTNHEFALVEDHPDAAPLQLSSSPGPGGEYSAAAAAQSPKFLVKQEEEILEQQEIFKLLDDLITEVVAAETSQSADPEVHECVTDLINTVVAGGETTKQKDKPPLQRPKTLDFGRERSLFRPPNSWMIPSQDDPMISILVNRCSYNPKDRNLGPNQLFPSTLVSPDTPRSKRKYQQLFLNGNTYSNLGLKVSLRPTYCCMYRLQPMFVTQEANPQLSMYSQWKTHPVPDGDALALVKSPNQLLSAYDSQEAVFHAARSRLGLMKTASVKGGITDINDEIRKLSLTETTTTVPAATAAGGSCIDPTTTTTSISEFLDKCRSRWNHLPAVDLSALPKSAKHPRPIGQYERTLKALVRSLNEGFTERVVDVTTETFFILAHSSAGKSATITAQSSSASPTTGTNNKSSRRSRVSFASVPLFERPGSGKSEMAIGSGTEPPTTVFRPRHASTSTGFTPALMDQLPAVLPGDKSKQTMVYIMMMAQQVPPVNALPSVQQIMSSATKNLAARKFSDCIGLRTGPNAYDQEQAWRIAGQDGFTPKRIKIFEGGFKSNEDYTYIRGRGRGKYICESCGIRCKKPSMLKKHIRTHTDLRPYSCQHCRFAFKTKGNLTKHMKSKAHHKKCVELGVVPVPTSIDDSQIDNDALAQQELCELNSQNSLTSLSQFGDEEDDDYDEEDDGDDDEDEDDEGMPMAEPPPPPPPWSSSSQRLTYIEPGQFDDAAEDSTAIDEADNGVSGKRKKRSETSVSSMTMLVSSSASGTLRKISTMSLNSTSNTSSSSSTASIKGLAIGAGSPPSNGGDNGGCQRNRIMDNVAEQRRSPDHPPSSAVLNLEPNDDNHQEMVLNERSNGNSFVQPLAPVSPNHGISASMTVTSSPSIVVGQNENEADAVHSLLILSSGAGSSMPLSSGGSNRNTLCNHDLIGPNPSILQQSTASSPSSAKASTVMKLKNSMAEPVAAGKTAMVTAAAATFIPQLYGYDTASLRNPVPSPSMPTQQSSHPTSVIIANRQASWDPAAHIDRHHHDFQAKKRNRMSPMESQLSHSPTNSAFSKPNHKNPHSISTIINEPALAAAAAPGSNVITAPESAFTIVDGSGGGGGQRRTITDFGTAATQQQSVGHPDEMTAPPPLIPAKFYALPNNLPQMPSSTGGGLPSIVEQSLNRYVKTAAATSQPPMTPVQMSPPVPPLVVPDQDQPIDLSAKSATTTPVIIENGSLMNQLTVQTTEVSPHKRSSPSDPMSSVWLSPSLGGQGRPSPVSAAAATSHRSPQQQPQPMIERQRLTEQMVRSFSTYEDVLARNFTTPNQTVNGHSVYQGVRSEEFAHLAPGMPSPHRLPANLQLMLQNLNNNQSSQQQTSTDNNIPVAGQTGSPNAPAAGSNKSYGEEKPTCPTCMKQFSKPSLLRLHFNLHQFERPFRCESCSISFRTKGHLQKHARSVSHMNKLTMSITFGRPSTDNPRPFKCSDCKIAFRIHGHLAKHLRSKMHIMKLECLGKLPFGMFAEIERKNINLTSLDTTDCGKALETLQKLAQSLYNTTQMCWKNATVMGTNNNRAAAEEPTGSGPDDDMLLEMTEQDDDDGDDAMDDDVGGHRTTDSDTTTIKAVPDNKPDLEPIHCVMANGTTPTPASTVSSLSGTIASTRSNTCHLCGQVFKAAKFLQVHLYCEHPETTGIALLK